MKKFDVPHDRFVLVNKPEEIEKAVDIVKNKFGSKRGVVIKSQVLAGGRGKGHFEHGDNSVRGVNVVKFSDKKDFKKIAEKMIGHTLFTAQTGEKGVAVNKIIVSEMVALKRELYFAMLLDRSVQGAVIVASTEGGMSIEEVAHKTPEKIHKTIIKNLDAGVSEKQWDEIVKELKLDTSKELRENAKKCMKNLWKMFTKSDATLVEINPMVETEDKKVFCIDAKLNFDDFSGFRQKEIFDMRDPSCEDPREVEATKFDLNYVGLDGNIGCLVNGAGLAMATMDIIKLYGGEPANFLDVGGSASEKQVTEAFKIIKKDPKVKAILVNIFGGIAKCDLIARGVVNAAKAIGLDIPLVVRLSGTNAEQGKEILRNSGLDIIAAENLEDAAIKATQCLKKE